MFSTFVRLFVLFGIFVFFGYGDGGGFIWEFQQPTYLLEKDMSGLATYTCDTSKESCKVNFDFSGSIPTEEPSTHYACVIDFGFGVTGEENKCNPNTVEFPVGTWNVLLTVKKVADESMVRTGSLQIIHPDGSIDPTRVTFDREWQSPSYVLLKEDTSLTEYSCNSEESECKVNLLVTPKLDGADSSELTCEITADFELVPTTDPCNPNTSIIPEGEHVLMIKILGKKDASLLQTSSIVFKNIPKDTTIDPTRVVTEITFQQPTYLLERSDTTLENYTCDPSQDICKINLLVTPKLDGAGSDQLSCSISSDFGFTEADCNPHTVEVPNGMHSIVIATKNSTTGETIQTRTLKITWEHPIFVGGSSIAMIDLSVVQLTIQSGLDTDFICTTDMCTVNFLVEVPGGAMCLWDFGSGTFETIGTNEKCNPGYVKFPTDSSVILTVKDPNYPTNFITKALKIQKLKPKNDLENEQKECPECSKDFLGKLHISAALPNPPHADTVEWIEVTNTSPDMLDLRSCTIGDTTKKYAFTNILPGGATVRLQQAITGLSLGNTKEELYLECGGTRIDTFSWDFSVPENYILRREILTQKPEKVFVSRTIDGDTIEVLQNGKKVTVRMLGIDTPETVHPNKPIQEFGIEASRFTKKLVGQDVWLTYDIVPIDLYGRRLAYVWICSGDFSENSCTLFNEVILQEGYGRMERRFPFARYASFDATEKEAKMTQKGLWGLEDVKKVMTELTQDEKEFLTDEKEQEYLRLQKELLELCETDPIPECAKKDIDWKTLTGKITTLNVSVKKSGKIEITGRTWEDYSAILRILQGETELQKWDIQTDRIGEYSQEWIPKNAGIYRCIFEIQKEGKVVSQEKVIEFVTPSLHFSESLEANILLQGQITDNRWQVGSVFHCRSRGSCSVNVTAETNREGDVSYLWLFPDGEIFEEKNPTSIKLGYGQYQILLIVVDDITEETSIQTLQIDHTPIPKKGKNSNSSKSKTYILDLKNTKIEGGGIPPEASKPKSSLKDLFSSVILVIFLAGMGYWTLLIYKP